MLPVHDCLETFRIGSIMRNCAFVLSLIAMSSNAVAAPSRYLSGREILASFTDYTMLWEDYRTPDKPSAVVHYSPGNELSILYNGRIVPNEFEFEGDGTVICWRQKTVCRSFLYDGGEHVYVVNPDDPDEWLAEVTRVTEDREGTVFHKIAQAELDHQAPFEVADAAPAPQPAPEETPRASSDRHFSASDAVVAALIIGMMAEAYSGGGSSTGSSISNQYYQNCGPASRPEPAQNYTAPVGGENGLYGSSHGVGD